MAEVIQAATLTSLLEHVIGRPLLRHLEEVLVRCHRRFLITVDGFDNRFNDFRSQYFYKHDELRPRVEFELDWLRGLLHMILDIREKSAANALYSHTDCCITIPRDRFYEVLYSDRDSFRYTDKYCSLEWSGIELALLLRKRVEELVQTSSAKDLRVHERLSQALRTAFPNIPEDIVFEYNGRLVSRPLFIYVLRHTFWRPRDILIYYGKLFAAATVMSRRKVPLTSDFLRRIIKESTISIINDEFINEFSGMVLNLTDIIQLFSHRPNILSFEDVAGILGKATFEVASSENPFSDVRSKIEFLYQIGFLGLEVSAEQKGRYNLRMKDVFYFTEGPAVIIPEAADHLHGFRYIVHPVFSEYLYLLPTNPELLLDPSWEDLYFLDNLMPVLSSQIVLRRRRGERQTLAAPI
jgi:hypothetical protein